MEQEAKQNEKKNDPTLKPVSKSKTLNFKVFRAKSAEELERLEKRHRSPNFNEHIPFAVNTPLTELAENIVPDKDGKWATPILYLISSHSSNIGAKDLLRKADKWLRDERKKKRLDILSLSAGMENNRLTLKSVIRVYDGKMPNIQVFFEMVGDSVEHKEVDQGPREGHLVIPEEIANFSYTPEQKATHKKAYAIQSEVLRNATQEKPFLNQIEQYIPRKMYSPEEHIPLVYDLQGKEKDIKMLTDYNSYTEIFKEIMRMVSGTEYYHYVNVMTGEEEEEEFLKYIKQYLMDKYISDTTDGLRLCIEDLPYMMDKINNALFKLYVVQDLIDDPNVTDVKITAPDSIRARVEGRAYKSNINFVDGKDYERFVNGICLRNGVNQNVPDQTFTDSHDDNYILRFSLIAAYVTPDSLPYLHIRKVDRKKLLGDDLIAAGMLTPKTRDYLLDCGKNSRGVVFAGPPGSGKTVCLNWFLEEAYEQSAEILVIQENDELFTYRDGVMFEHVVNYTYRGQQAVSLEQLGQLALVAGANVFIIGEAKGAEICSAITLSNSGCRTAITIHSPSSTETLDKMADLAMRGYAQDYDQAKRMLKSFQTVVYLQDFKIREISEITGYNDKTKDMEYRYIYRYEEEEE